MIFSDGVIRCGIVGGSMPANGIKKYTMMRTPSKSCFQTGIPGCGSRSTGMELRYDAMEGVRRWIRHTEDEIRHYHERVLRERPVAAPPPERHADWHDAVRWQAIYGQSIVNPRYFGIDFASEQIDKKAEKRAKDLFRMVAGKEAYERLQAGTLPIKGSNGTPYILHRRATYCIERPNDGAQLCAVIPNVPLWDHLLGIKLMVEHDEPRFLKTANVSGGRRDVSQMHVRADENNRWEYYR